MIFNRIKSEFNYIIFEVTPRCNLSCKYCYNYWKRPDDNSKIEESGYAQSRKTLKKLFSQARIKHVTFTGGEPFLAERVLELALYCRMKGASVSFITNGNTATEAEFKQLISVGVNLFELPIHSAKSLQHDTMTGRIGSWAKSVDSIKTIIKNEANVVPVIVITKYNFAQVGETLKFIASLGLKRVMLNRYNIGGNGIKDKLNILPTKIELNEAFAQAAIVGNELGMILTSNVCTPHCVVNPSDFPSIRFSNCSPDLSKRPLTMNAQGEIRFCNHSPIVLGSIFEANIETIIENANPNHEEKRPALCTNCQLFAQCMGGCRAAAQQIGLTFSDIDPIVELNLSKESSYETNMFVHNLNRRSV